ncbi:Hypothetical_protein [Hexamita inflata]|uniref:Hypothetical_protein n=1 Tax=Hexamita inflata TaxID=28002 RepID=A0AA86QW72_9EUKA|nr:Hypothetical protein HINF_LOCUS50138 [Hexamita inflata]CAI9962496.1 Hypothetical protein HINF_LOCUS50141 [Hexamita inflata]CAI9962502.1 Hypothetical protein HINF_LOCUS50147 [Hexamita inflata]
MRACVPPTQIISTEQFVNAAFLVLNTNQYLEFKISSPSDLPVAIKQLTMQQANRFWVELSFHLNVDFYSQVELKPESTVASCAQNIFQSVVQNFLDDRRSQSQLSSPPIVEESKHKKYYKHKTSQNKEKKNESFKAQFVESLRQTVAELHPQNTVSESNLFQFVERIDTKLKQKFWAEMEVKMDRPKKQLLNYFIFLKATIEQ